MPWHSTVAKLNKVYGYLWASWTKELQKRNLKEYEDRNKARFTRKILRWKIQRLLNQAYRRTHQNVFYYLKAGYVVRSILRKVHKLIEHAVAKEREMINNDDDRENSGGKFWWASALWGEIASMLSFQTGICSNIGHGFIVWWSRYLGRGGDQETSKGACFLALKIRKISSPSADNAAAQITQIKRTTSFIYGHGEQSKQSKRIRIPMFTENKISKNFSNSSLSFLLASINRS